MVYLNFNAIFEFLGQFTVRCIYMYFFSSVDDFEISTKHGNMLIFGYGCSTPLNRLKLGDGNGYFR